MTLVGVDIGTTAIKISALERAGGGVRLVAESIAPLPPGAVGDGWIENPSPVSRALETVLETLGLRGADAVVSLPCCGGSIVLERDASVPTGTSFGDWARATAEEAAPFDAEDIVIAAERAPAYGVRLVVARRNHLEAYRDSVQQGGARVVGIDSELLALERYHRAAHPDEGGLAVGLLDIGLSSPKIAVVQSGRLLLSNSFCCDPEAFLGELPGMVGIRLRTRVGEGVVQRLRLSGGASRITGLGEALRDCLGIPVDPLGPSGLKFPEDPTTAVSRGLALRLVLPGVEIL